jgi:hypothetical protein
MKIPEPKSQIPGKIQAPNFEKLADSASRSVLIIIELRFALEPGTWPLGFPLLLLSDS